MKQTICDNPDCRHVIKSGDFHSTLRLVRSSSSEYYSKEYEFCGVCTGRVTNIIGSQFREEFVEEIVK